ncbi:FimV/HubP family polar landmark protein [Rheinheimera sp. WS51]|uniref:FimV/HubP family polar landmark protein n=1 Tax=Rheinheimera sp. WS51 TaxID=3425886 RepID=UPI003D8D9FAC
MPVLFVIFFAVLVNFSAPLFAQDNSVQIRGPRGTDTLAQQKSIGPLSADDTLWRVAEQLRPNSNVSLYQVMYAIYKKNPDAFLENNLNHLKPNSVLAVPTLEEVFNVDLAQAKQKSEQDDKIWAQRQQRAKTTILAEKAANTSKANSNQAIANNAIANTTTTSSPASTGPWQQELETLTEQQRQQLTDLRSKFEDSVQQVQSLAIENQQLRSSLSSIQTELENLKQQLGQDGELQQQLASLLAQQAELLKANSELKAQSNQDSVWQSALKSPLVWILAASIPALIMLFSVLLLIKRRGKQTEEVVNAVQLSETPDPNYQSPLPPLDANDDFDESLFELDDALLDESFVDVEDVQDEQKPQTDLDDNLLDFGDELLDDESVLAEVTAAEKPEEEPFDPDQILSDTDISALLMAEEEDEELDELAEATDANNTVLDEAALLDDELIDDISDLLDEPTAETKNTDDEPELSDELLAGFTGSQVATNSDTDKTPELPEAEQELTALEDSLTEQADSELSEALQPEQTANQTENNAAGLSDADLIEQALDETSDEAETEAEIEAEDDTELEAVVKLEDDTESEAVAELEDDVDSEAVVELEDDADSEVVVELEDDAESEAVVELEDDAESEAVVELEDDAESEAVTETEEETTAETTEPDQEDSLTEQGRELAIALQQTQAEEDSLVKAALAEEQQQDADDETLLTDIDEFDSSELNEVTDSLDQEHAPDLSASDDGSVAKVTDASLSVENPSQMLEQYPTLDLSEDDLSLDIEELSASEFTDNDTELLSDEEVEVDPLSEQQFDSLMGELEAIAGNSDKDEADETEFELNTADITDVAQVDNTDFDFTDDDFVEIDKLLAATDEQESDPERFNQLNVDVGLDEFADVIGNPQAHDVDQDDNGFAAKLDLARAYIEMDDQESAAGILEGILASEAAEHVKQEAAALKLKL